MKTRLAAFVLAILDEPVEMRLARLAGKRAEFHYTPPNSWEDPGSRRGVGERSRQ